MSLTGLLDTVSCQVQVLSYIQNNLIALEVAHGVERGKARRMETSEFLLNKFLTLGTAILHMSQKIYSFAFEANMSTNMYKSIAIRSKCTIAH